MDLSYEAFQRSKGGSAGSGTINQTMPTSGGSLDLSYDSFIKAKTASPKLDLSYEAFQKAKTTPPAQATTPPPSMLSNIGNAVGGAANYVGSNLQAAKEIATPTLLESFPGTIQALADLQTNPFGLNKMEKDFAGKAYNDTINSNKDLLSKASDFVESIKQNKSLSAKIGTGLSLLESATGVAFSPISAVFQGIEQMPVVSSLAKLATLPATALGEMFSYATGKGVEATPFSPQTKENLKAPLQGLASLAGQTIGYGALGETLPKSVDPVLKMRSEAVDTLNSFSNTKVGLKSSPSILRKAYLEASKVTHPDLNAGNDTNFKDVNGAFRFLNGKENAFARTSALPTQQIAAPEAAKPIPQAQQTIEPTPQPIPQPTPIAPRVLKTPKTEVAPIPSFDISDTHAQNTIGELRISQAGTREMIKDPVTGNIDKVFSSPSTFPDWIPSRLRDSKLVNQVADILDSGGSPKTKPEKDLYDLTTQRIEKLRNEARTNEPVTFGDGNPSDILGSKHYQSSRNREMDRYMKTQATGPEGFNLGANFSAEEQAAAKTRSLEVIQKLRQSKGLSASDIMAKHPDINLKRDVPITDIHGVKQTIPAGEALTPYELKGNKVLLQDGETYIVSKNQYQNIKGNAISGEAMPLKKPSGIAPEFTQKAKAENSITLKAELIPGLTQAIQEDVIPKAKGAIGGLKAIGKEVTALVNPRSLAPKEAVDILMTRKGELERQQFRTERAMKKIKNMWEKQPPEANLAFMDKVERGVAVPKEFTDLATSYRERLNNAHAAIAEFKDVPFIENFFPHFWKDPKIIEKDFIPSIAGRRPLAGSKSFLKERVFETIQKGIQAGYTPISTNPEELMQIYETNVRKFVMAQNIKADMLAKGLWKFVKKGERAPKGFTQINDGIAKVYFPEQVTTASGEPATRITQSGEYYVEENTARLINNFLSKDFIYQTRLGTGLMNVKNTMNAFQLGFSGFHLLFETLDTITSRFSTGVSKIATGHPISGAMNMISSPAAPFLYFKEGWKFFNGAPETMKYENDLFTGGASLKSRQYFKNTVFDNFVKNVRSGNYVSALLRLPMAAVEGMMRPLFSYYIPRLKIGAWRDLYTSELIRNASRIEKGTLTREELARKTWDNIENRLGELNYDNLFWNKTFKSANMLTWRATGWNLGTLRELGGAPVDLFNIKKTGFTPKMSYVLSLFSVIGAVGAIYHYLHTGKRPESLKDIYYPKNGAQDKYGNDYRIQLPSYLKDVYAYGTHPLRTIGHKLSPEFSLVIDLLQNKDFFGDEIYNPNNSLPKEIQQIGAYLVSQFEPFSVQQEQQLKQGGSPAFQRGEAFFGITKAPREMIIPARQQQIEQALHENNRQMGPRTPEQKSIDDLKAQAREEIRHYKYDTLNMLVKNKVVKNRAEFIRDARMPVEKRLLNQLPKAARRQFLNTH